MKQIAENQIINQSNKNIMETKEKIVENHTINELNENKMETGKKMKIAKRVYEGCIKNSYLGSEEDYRKTIFFEELTRLFKKYDDDDFFINVNMAFERYQIHSTPRFVTSNDNGYAVPCIDKDGNIQDILEFALQDNYCGYPLGEGDLVEIADNVWAKNIKYHLESWGSKAYCSGAEIMKKQGYILQNKKCFVGGHLPSRDEERPIIIFDNVSEAFIYSIIDDDHICLARGCSRMNIAPELDSAEAKEILKGREVKVISTFENYFPVYARLYHSLNNGVSISDIRENVYKHCTKLQF